MSCKNCKGNCGCNEKPVTLPEYEKKESYPEVCSEIFYDACIMHGQVCNIADINGNQVIIHKGERLDSILQKILNALSDSENCGVIAYNFKIKSYTNESIVLSWEGEGDYELHVVTDSEEVFDVADKKTFTYNCASEGTYNFFLVDKMTDAKSVTLKLTI